MLNNMKLCRVNKIYTQFHELEYRYKIYILILPNIVILFYFIYIISIIKMIIQESSFLFYFMATKFKCFKCFLAMFISTILNNMVQYSICEYNLN